ncbi:MAG: hypothetical protein Q7J31_05965 [Syntrophales bacterium]|nr:hypothetical protein [Syntrophales bacterium]
MKKENIYVALINTLLGMGVASLLQGSVLAYALIVILIGTIIFIERKWIFENVFRWKKWYAVAGYSVLAAVMLVFLFFITAPSRDTTLIVKRVNGFLQNVTAGNYRDAYEQLSEVSKKAYALDDFADDHKEKRIKFQNFIIHEVAFNKYDKRQAVAMVSSPFMLYGRETLNLEMIKEGGEWRIDFSRTIVNPDAPGRGKSRKKAGSITNFLNKLF